MPDTTNMSDDELRNALIDAWDDGTRGSQYDRSGWDSVVRYVRTLFPAAAKPPERWATAMTESNGHIYASCNDGTTWELPDGRIVWDQLSSIPSPTHRPSQSAMRSAVTMARLDGLPPPI